MKLGPHSHSTIHHLNFNYAGPKHPLSLWHIAHWSVINKFNFSFQGSQLQSREVMY